MSDKFKKNNDMSYLNTKSGRTFDFVAPYTEEGERCQRIPFPIAVNRKPVDSGNITHDCNPQVMTFDSNASAGTFTVKTLVQAGSILIVNNEHASNKQTVGGVECAANDSTVLMWTGKKYVRISEAPAAGVGG